MVGNLIAPTCGRAKIAELILEDVHHMAWGDLQPSTPPWYAGSVPDFSASGTLLDKELGRIECAQATYVTPDTGGTIEDEFGGKYSISVEPSKWLYFRAVFTSDLETTATIRQIGLFRGTRRWDASLPAISCLVNNFDGYSVGANAIQLDGFTGGAIGDLLPFDTPVPPNSAFGRTITFASHPTKYYIYDIDSASSIIHISPALVHVVLNNEVGAVAATTLVDPGVAYLTPSQVADPGTLMLAKDIEPIARDASSRNQFELILPL